MILFFSICEYNHSLNLIVGTAQYPYLHHYRSGVRYFNIETTATLKG